jgi:hypothetical protein
MHYKNGREAKNGDKVIHVPKNGTPVAGILYDAIPGNDYCNGRIAVTTQSDPYANLKECLHADDVATAEIANSLGVPDAPPIDNDHVADGCEKFAESPVETAAESEAGE